jgi:hypothetical protein
VAQSTKMVSPSEDFLAAKSEESVQLSFDVCAILIRKLVTCHCLLTKLSLQCGGHCLSCIHHASRNCPFTSVGALDHNLRFPAHPTKKVRNVSIGLSREKWGGGGLRVNCYHFKPSCLWIYASHNGVCCVVWSCTNHSKQT